MPVAKTLAAYPACTIQGTSATETLTGTALADIICTGGGNDTVNALGGDDIVIAEIGGEVTVDLGSGDDTFDGSDATKATVNGGDGDDEIIGSVGNDTLSGGTGVDAISGGLGDDIINGGSGNDELDGDSGHDTITGDAGDDIIDGGDGGDTLSGSGGDDSIVGGPGGDVLSGDDGSDTLTGGEGNDRLSGSVGEDDLEGGDGDDSLTGGEDIDQVNGGGGLNYCSMDMSDVTSSCAFDESGPTIESIEFSTTTVDVSKSAATVDVSLHLTDVSGINNFGVVCSAPNSNQYSQTYAYYQAWNDSWYFGTDDGRNSTNPTLTITGDRLDLRVTMPLNIKKWAKPGNYYCYFNSNDSLHNFSSRFPGSVPPMPSLEVTRSSGNYDEVGPTIESLTFSATTIEVGTSAATVDVSLHLTDESGINTFNVLCYAPNWNPYFQFYAYYEAWNDSWGFSSYDGRNTTNQPLTITGDRFDVSVTMPLTIAQGSKPGTYTCYLHALDILNNLSSRYSWDTPPMPSLEVTRSSGTYDEVGPTIESLTFSATTVEVGTSAATVDVSLHLTDVSGINLFYINCYTPYSNQYSQAYAYYQAGNDSWYLQIYDGKSYTVPTVTITGDRFDLSITMPLVLAQGYKPGTYSCYFYAYDSLSNYSYRDSGSTPPLPSLTVMRTPPGLASAPRNLAFQASTGTLAWESPLNSGNPSLKYYAVQWSVDGITWSDFADASSSTNRAFVATGLEPDTDYWLRVRGENGYTEGKDLTYISVSWSTLKVHTTTVPNAPIALTTSSITGSGFKLAWKFGGGAAIYDYNTEISSDGGSTWTAAESSLSTSTSVTVTGALAGRTYLVRVAAINVVGLSSYLTGSVVTTISAPSVPLNLSTAGPSGTGLTLDWDTPEGNGGAAISDYKVEFSSNGGAKWTAITHAASNSRTFSVSALTRGLTYQFRVSAVNSKGAGPASSTVSVLIPAAAPDAPTTLAVTTITKSGAALSWKAPVSNGGSAITNYAVEYSLNSGSSWQTLVHAVSTAVKINLSGLTSGTTYMFRVSAVSLIGTGAASTPTTFATLGTPRNLTAPSLEGSATTGSTLTASVGTWAANPVATFTYAWLRCTQANAALAGGVAPAGCTIIKGATASTYVAVAGDLTKWLTVRITAKNSQGSAIYFSASTSQITAP